MRMIRLRKDNGKVITLYETESILITYSHEVKNGMVGWSIQKEELGKASEILSGGYALANRQAEHYINSEIIRVFAAVRGLRWI